MTEKATAITLRVNNHSSISKFIQVAKCISEDILNGNIKNKQRIPSINELSDSSGLSCDIIEKAYEILRDRGLIFSDEGRGYFAVNNDSEAKKTVFFMINKPSSYK